MKISVSLCAIGLACLPAVSAAGPPGAPASPQAATSPASSLADELERMLRVRPDPPVILPAAVEGRKEPAPRPPVPEGVLVIDRPCRLAPEPESRWLVLAFEDMPQRPATAPAASQYRLLPCVLLEKMEEVAARDPAAVFRITGETTAYRGRNYLMPRKVTVERPRRPGPVKPAREAKPPEPTTKPAPGAAPGATSRPADRGKPIRPKDILRRLLEARPAEPLLLPTGRARPVTSQPSSVAPGAGKVLAPGRGGMAIDRLVRILPEQDSTWYLARFEADNTLREPPLRLLPCQFLQRAEALISRDEQMSPARLRISGEITNYKGMSYLLLRKLLPVREMRQF